MSPEATELRHVPDAELWLRWGRLAAANRFLKEYVDERTRSAGEDIISAMLKVRDQDGTPALPSGAVMRHLISLIGTGHDTTANAIAHLVKNFSDFPAELERVTADSALYPNAVEEGMRMRGSVPGATCPDEVVGRSLPMIVIG